MRRLDTHDSEELHVKPGVVPTVLIITVAVCKVLLRNLELIDFVLSSLHMIVHPGRASFTKGRAVEAFSMVSIAFGTFPSSQFTTNDTLSWRIFNDIGDVEDLRGQNPILDFELPAHTRHLPE